MILLDTQAVAWLAMAPEKLSPAADAAIETARQDGGIAIAGKSLWEIAMMIQRRKIAVHIPLREFLQSIEQYCTVLPITSAVAALSVQLSANFPNDPADRIIAATAIVHGMKLVTSDALIRKSGEVSCIW
jgi:PIN domain nuclease of toxin-antitoxin system